jgi:hypothetical protein
MGEKFEENHAVPVVRPAGGHLWWPEPVLFIPTAGARRRFVSRRVGEVIGIVFGHM